MKSKKKWKNMTEREKKALLMRETEDSASAGLTPYWQKMKDEHESKKGSKMRSTLVSTLLAAALFVGGCGPAAVLTSGLIAGSIVASSNVGDSSGWKYKDSYYLPPDERTKGSLDEMLARATTVEHLESLKSQLFDHCRYHPNLYLTSFDVDWPTYDRELTKITTRQAQLLG